MKEVAVYEAKTRLSEMLVEVERGEQYTITRRGVAVARLVAADPAASADSAAAQQRQRVRGSMAALRSLRTGTVLDMPLPEAIGDGRD